VLDQAVSTHYVGDMQIDLTPEQQDFVRKAVESGRFERAEDAVQAALTLWVERERRRAEILAAVDVAQASIARGEGIEITRESMRALADEIKQRGRSQFAAENRSDR
jgi:putative addiction module CopG family antidote